MHLPLQRRPAHRRTWLRHPVARHHPPGTFTIAHELGHQALHHDYSEVRARGRHGVIPFLTVALGSIAAAAIVVSNLPLLVRTGATSLMILATLTAVEIITTRRVQDELHANEYAADDFATTTVGVTGANILATLTGLAKIGSTHPLGADRYAPQLDRARSTETPTTEHRAANPGDVG